MIKDTMKQIRKEKGMSQEELALQLHIVRQTVSKWESGLSVPDAEMLIQLAEVLNVSTSVLLGKEVKEETREVLAEELASMNKQLAENNRILKRQTLANEKRMLIISCTFFAMLSSLIIKNSIYSLVISGICLVVALVILYKNLALLTNIQINNNLFTTKLMTIINIFMILIICGIALLTKLDIIHITKDMNQMFTYSIVVFILLLMGMIAPKLPFNRHTGLRLPWTIRDEETWNLAHRIIGYISLPMAFIYLSLVFTLPSNEIITPTIIIIWVLIPSFLSLIYYVRKTKL